jgi:hypothetical protein
MKKIALIAIVLLAGCAATDTQTPVTDPKIASLEQERRAIAEREQQCIDNTLIHGRDEMAHLTATAASGDLPMQLAKNERDRQFSECRAKADSDNAQISERERNEYALEAQQERDRASLMMILTTTRLR